METAVVKKNIKNTLIGVNIKNIMNKMISDIIKAFNGLLTLI